MAFQRWDLHWCCFPAYFPLWPLLNKLKRISFIVTEWMLIRYRCFSFAFSPSFPWSGGSVLSWVPCVETNIIKSQQHQSLCLTATKPTVILKIFTCNKFHLFFFLCSWNLKIKYRKTYHKKKQVYMWLPRNSAEPNLSTVMYRGQQPVCHNFL